MAPPDPQRGAKNGPRADRPYAGFRKCAPGAIRTHTVRGLNALPPACWATEAISPVPTERPCECLPCDSNAEPSGLQPDARPLELERHESEARESNSVCPAPKAGGSAISLAPEIPGIAWVFMLSTVEFSRFDTDGVPWCGHGWQESNLRHPVLETGALAELSYTHREKCWRETKNAAWLGDLPEGGVSRWLSVYARRRAG